jgi:cobalt-zinc-cadmium efflux system protein
MELGRATTYDLRLPKGHLYISPMSSIASRAECAHLNRGPATPLPRLWAVLGLTGTFMVLEAVGGWVAGSLALLADAGHMLTDVGALALSLLTAWIAQRPADATKTYGYLRWEILAALVNGAALFGIAGWVVVEAIQRIQHPGPIRTGLFLTIAAAGLAVNLVSLGILHGSRQGSLNARGAYLHVMGDALGSIGALSAAAIVWFTGWTIADPIVSIALSLLILVGAWRLLRESTDILLDAVPSHVAMADVQRRILGVPGVAAVHDLHVWTVVNGVVAMSGHAVVPDLDSHPEVLDGIRAQMATLGIGHVTMQLEVADECEEVRAAAGTGAGGHEGHRH